MDQSCQWVLATEHRNLVFRVYMAVGGYTILPVPPTQEHVRVLRREELDRCQSERVLGPTMEAYTAT